MATPEYALPSWVSRAKLAAMLALLIAWAYSHQLWMPALAAKIDSSCGCEALAPARLGALYFVVLPIPVALLAGWFAQRIHRSGQVPPPGTWLMVRTRVRRGSWAKVAVATYAVFGIGMAILPGVIAYELDISYLYCIAEPCGCPEPGKPVQASVPTGRNAIRPHEGKACRRATPQLDLMRHGALVRDVEQRG